MSLPTHRLPSWATFSSRVSAASSASTRASADSSGSRQVATVAAWQRARLWCAHGDSLLRHPIRWPEMFRNLARETFAFDGDRQWSALAPIMTVRGRVVRWPGYECCALDTRTSSLLTVTIAKSTLGRTVVLEMFRHRVPGTAWALRPPAPSLVPAAARGRTAALTTENQRGPQQDLSAQLPHLCSGDPSGRCRPGGLRQLGSQLVGRHLGRRWWQCDLCRRWRRVGCQLLDPDRPAR